MRRFAFILAVLGALAVPAVGSAARDASGDGSLVVRNGAAPDDTPVVALKKFGGSVIGRVDIGRIIIDSGPNCDPAASQVVGAGRPTPVKGFDTAQKWVGTDFTFRAIGSAGCTFTIVVYGVHVNLVAAGRGAVRIAGQPDTPVGDGKYSLNDADFRSLPGVQSAWLSVGDAG